MVTVISDKGDHRIVRDKTLGEMMQYQCPLCHSWYFYGPHRYDGTKIMWADEMICNGCYRGNHDGFNDHQGKILKALAESNGLPIPKVNSKGWLPRD